MQSGSADFTRDVYSVTRLVREARSLLEGSFPALWIEGELSNLACPASGHIYFSLKDAGAQVRCAMFRSRNMLLKFRPENGVKLLVRGRVSLYEGRGEFQLIVEQMDVAGEGALRLAFEQLRSRLSDEGLFSDDIKQPMPRFPRAVGVVTSPSGAVIRDILSVLGRRFPAIPVILYPVPVQGDGAAARIARMIALADRRGECDILILARGGGSLEDLWAFNEEVVARAIFTCGLPIVSAIGHEVDWTIADFVADQRAPTPSVAAELVSPDQSVLFDELAATEDWLTDYALQRLRRFRETVDMLRRGVVHPGRYVQQQVQRLDDISLRMQAGLTGQLMVKSARLSAVSAVLQGANPLIKVQQSMARCSGFRQRLGATLDYYLAGLNAKLDNLGRALDAVSPLATLRRGYAIVTKRPQGLVVRDADELAPGDRIQARLDKGSVDCRVEVCVSEDSST